MPTFTVKVTETRVFECLYVVEAENADEARELAEAGETLQEVDIKLVGITDRQPETPRETKDFGFKTDATETQRGTAYFTVEAADEDEAELLLKAHSSDYYTDFSESDGGVEWGEHPVFDAC